MFAVPSGQPIQPPAGAAQACSSYMVVLREVKIAVITFILGLVLFLPYIVSPIVSLHMVRKGYMVKHRGMITAFSIIEIISYVFVLSFSWFFTEHQECNYYYYYYYPTRYCYTYVDYWGWISIVVWFAVAMAFGIPRLTFTAKYNITKPNANQGYAPVTYAW